MPETEKTVVERITARVPERDLKQLAVGAKEVEEAYSGAVKVVEAYGVDAEATKELTLKIAVYNIYLRAASSTPEHIAKDYELSLKILNDLKNSAKIESSGSFSMLAKTAIKEDLRGY